MILLLKLFLAHILGDFALQPSAWIADKEQHKIASRCLYQHAIVHFALLVFIVQDIHFWKYALLIVILHLLTDLLKVYKQPAHNLTGFNNLRQRWFFYDQLLHLATLFLVWYLYATPAIGFALWDNAPFIICFTGFVLVTQPASVLIKVVISPWNTSGAATSIPSISGTSTTNSLANAGKIIGYIERILTVIMMLNGHWESIGFLIAAKSVLRIGDVRDNRDKNMTEYILVGTLLSFGIAIIVGLGMNYLLAVFS